MNMAPKSILVSALFFAVVSYSPSGMAQVMNFIQAPTQGGDSLVHKVVDNGCGPDEYGGKFGTCNPGSNLPSATYSEGKAERKAAPPPSNKAEINQHSSHPPAVTQY